MESVIYVLMALSLLAYLVAFVTFTDDVDSIYKHSSKNANNYCSENDKAFHWF